MSMSALMAAALVALAPGVGGCAEPDAPPAEARADWTMTSITLYLPDFIVGERVPVRDLAAYIERLKVEAADAFAGQTATTGMTGTIIFIVQPDGRSRVWIVSGEPGLDAAVSNAIAARLANVPTPRVSVGPVAAGLNFDAWGGGAPPSGMPMPIPESWRRLIPEGGVRMDDEFLAKVWRQG